MPRKAKEAPQPFELLQSDSYASNIKTIADMARDSLGDVEHFVLVALLHLEGESYVVPILREIARRTGREMARPAIYIALRRLAAKHFVTSRVGDPTPVRGGRGKRFFKLTPAGVRQLRESRDAFVRMWEGAEPLVRRAGD